MSSDSKKYINKEA